MEVHSHTHTARKKWTHYFWEFIMLFLAVFCGFLAENQREHMVEKRREKEYMTSMVENLKYDTIRCSKNAASNVIVFSGLDSLRNELKKAIDGHPDGNALYYFILHYVGNFGEAVFNTSAISELKNSGSIRLIEDKKLVGEIADYYERIIFATKDYMPAKEQADALQKTINDFFSLQYLDDYIQSYSGFTETDFLNKYNYRGILEHQPALQLLNDSPKELKKLYTEISQYEIQLKRYNFWLYKTKGAAEKLITDIQKEYHLK